ncbi:putative sugar O-methyltransferase [Bradyrhizobium diazoefficiens]|nr:putative sugar O-methyltransferase [Bradyrhizobium diazoefficiens]MBR0962702.1 putative sugar O-methyltransferase [Bradyrhizobium diazoefficiens]MBR0976862.1 putative sugar O-methyltransferase [Bradyrhizobium diazoefficiens]MBR1005507.1 putative sugar O-methyltransferase [Bradyrhizobium diazoefficiens]MBR1011980.1 putative sugar O-methyltransferase [Bradyrhizobium diazoefficiens]MBR1049321.1 putative sugar O-methyltransferase [Bradyrhizobium diazoefficiens]
MGIFDWFVRPSGGRTNLDIASHQHNRKLSKEDIQRAQRLGYEVKESVRVRRDQVTSSPEIDESFAMPAANWDPGAPNDYLECYNLLASLKPEEIRLLRFRAQNFTGNNLPRMAPGAGSGADPVADDLETRWGEEVRGQLVTHWQALTNNTPPPFILNAPNILGECGWWWNDRIVNADIVHYQERMSLIALSGILERFHGRPLRILEIGGGYGALCLGLLNALKPTQYVICDLPESLLFSSIYLATALNGNVRLVTAGTNLSQKSSEVICLLPNYLAQTHLPGQSFDLVINTLSMSEMSPHQVRTYARLISNSIGSHGVFFEQNYDNKDHGMIDCKDHLPPFFETHESIKPDIPIVRGLASAWSN